MNQSIEILSTKQQADLYVAAAQLLLSPDSNSGFTSNDVTVTSTPDRMDSNSNYLHVQVTSAEAGIALDGCVFILERLAREQSAA